MCISSRVVPKERKPCVCIISWSSQDSGSAGTTAMAVERLYHFREYVNNVFIFVRRMRTSREVNYWKQKTRTSMKMSRDTAGAFRGRVHAKLRPTIERVEE